MCLKVVKILGFQYRKVDKPITEYIVAVEFYCLEIKRIENVF